MKVLFVCTGNTCRSALAQHLATGVEARSAGLAAYPGQPMTPGAVRALGRDPGHRSQRVTEELVDWADVVVCMTRAHLDSLTALYPQYRAKYRTLKDTDVADPIGESDDVYAATAAEIKEALDELLKDARR